MRLVLDYRADSLSDPARFAEAIRCLAYDAHRTLTHAPSPTALRKLARRIEILSSVLGDRQGDPLKAWLDNVGGEVQSAALPRAGAPRPVCLCA